jgi:phosphoserine phosphatase RsbU/P
MRRILIAEDEAVTRRLLEGLTSSWGYDVAAVEDGEAALAVLQSDNPPELALLDWVMPGLQGPDICRLVRQQNSRTPTYIILLTARKASTDVVAGLEAGADDYLAKPFAPEELRARLSAGVRIVNLEQRLAAHVSDLEHALANVRRLSGLLPICSYCKSIRDDQDYWRRVEEYISDHSEVAFTHSICPKCYAEITRQMVQPDGR